MDIACATYEDELRAGKVVDALLATGFAANQIYVVVQRGRALRRAPVGRSRYLAFAMLIGATLIAAIGGIAAAIASQYGFVLPRPDTPGLRAPATAMLSLIPLAMIGALAGAAVGAWRWSRRDARFPGAGATGPTFVGVRVSKGNAVLAEQILCMGSRELCVAETEDPVEEARAALQRAPAA